MNQTCQEWEKHIYEDNDYIKNQDSHVKELFNGIIEELRNIYKEAGKQEPVRQLNSLISDKKAVNYIMGIVNKTLINYKAMSPVRKLEADKGELVKMLITAVFEKAMVRIELGVTETYGQYNLKSEEELFEIIQAISRLSEYYVKRHWAKKTVCLDFRDETGCALELCEFYAEMLERHYHELRLNILMDDIWDFNNRFDELNETI